MFPTSVFRGAPFLLGPLRKAGCVYVSYIPHLWFYSGFTIVCVPQACIPHQRHCAVLALCRVWSTGTSRCAAQAAEASLHSPGQAHVTALCHMLTAGEHVARQQPAAAGQSLRFRVLKSEAAPCKSVHFLCILPMLAVLDSKNIGSVPTLAAPRVQHPAPSVPAGP